MQILNPDQLTWCFQVQYNVLKRFMYDSVKKCKSMRSGEYLIFYSMAGHSNFLTMNCYMRYINKLKTWVECIIACHDLFVQCNSGSGDKLSFDNCGILIIITGFLLLMHWIQIVYRWNFSPALFRTYTWIPDYKIFKKFNSCHLICRLSCQDIPIMLSNAILSIT